ncbi:BtrH N-terminal domain-containing protein [Shewanella woodyi]|uniref:BtrH N-terminal domain-containing protein n=1 Tax=Shewanella woodyi TaxID=60961 RepID=UPI0007EAEA24|nr:BtrH N-terminal domain-containing protein [Shewanella woodyi]
MNDTLLSSSQPSAQISTNVYVHATGKHCESTCQRNILLSLGIDIEENIIFGLDASFGFAYHTVQGNSADIVLGKQAIFPMNAARLMGIDVEIHQSAGPSVLIELLKKYTAVITRVDISLLPYWGLAGKAPFGGYFINIIDYDEQSDWFEVSDSSFTDTQWIDSSELCKARSSTLSPPINPANWCCVFKSVKRQPNLHTIGPIAAKNLCREVLKPNFRNLGIPGIKKLAKSAQNWPNTKRGSVDDVDGDGNPVKSDALTRQLVYLGRQIELFGTGGGLFRLMISDFLTHIAKINNNETILKAAELFTESGILWQSVGQELLALSPLSSSETTDSTLKMLIHELAKIEAIEKSALEKLAFI